MESLGAPPPDRKEPLLTDRPELPLAYGHPETITTMDHVDAWLEGLARYAANGENARYSIREVVTNDAFDPDKALKKYQEELHFLPKSLAQEGLTQFAEEITETFDPKTSLFYFHPKSISSYFFHKNLIALNPKLATYGRAVDSYSALRLTTKNEFGSDELKDAKAFIYVDDWILSAEQMGIFLSTDVDEKFHTFHLAVSAQGQDFLKKTSGHLFPRYLNTMPSKVGFFPEVSVYGFHKIPDVLPDFYTKSKWADFYSIFGKGKDGFNIRKNQRLFDHDAVFINEKDDPDNPQKK